VGIEISPVHCLITWLRALLSGNSSRIRVRCASFYSSNLRDADVIYAYVTPEHGIRLRPYLEKQLHSGARVVTISAEIDGWQPEKIDRDDLVAHARQRYNVPIKSLSGIIVLPPKA
jgi:hypothetical protein